MTVGTALSIPCSSDVSQEAAARSFDNFVSGLHDCLSGQATRKGYSATGPDGPNALYEFCLAAGAEPGHSVGECLYKLKEFLHEPRTVLPLKIAAWCFFLFKATPKLREMKGLPPE